MQHTEGGPFDEWFAATERSLREEIATAVEALEGDYSLWSVQGAIQNFRERAVAIIRGDKQAGTDQA